MDAHSAFSISTTFVSRQVLMLSLVFLVVSPTRGQEATASWWNPMTWGSGDDSVRKSSYFSGSSKPAPADSKPLFSMPTMPWSVERQEIAPKPQSTGPSMIGKMGQSTKRAWNNTVDFLNPFDPAPAEPLQQGYQPQNTTTKSGSGMFGWMWREETTETPASVNEFLRQERPKF